MFAETMEVRTECSMESSSCVSHWDAQISKDLHLIIESRLRGVVEDQHRQHAIRELLEYLQSTANALAKTCGIKGDVNKPSELVQDNIYELHEMRMALQRSNLITLDKGHGPSADMEEEDSSSLLEQLSFTVKLLIWLMKIFGSTAFSHLAVQL